jgi:small subunit ribosomal protein S33
MSVVAPARLAALKQLQCAIFQTAYNPKSIRTGAKYLRARLRGPSMVKYYPPMWNVAQFRKTKLGAELMVDEAEEERVQDVEEKKARGKGAPTKAKSKGTWLHAHGLTFCSHIVQPTVVAQTGGDDTALRFLTFFNSASFLALLACLLYPYSPKHPLLPCLSQRALSTTAYISEAQSCGCSWSCAPLFPRPSMPRWCASKHFRQLRSSSAMRPACLDGAQSGP